MKIKFKYKGYKIICGSLRVFFYLLFSKEGKEYLRFLTNKMANVEGYTIEMNKEGKQC